MPTNLCIRTNALRLAENDCRRAAQAICRITDVQPADEVNSAVARPFSDPTPDTLRPQNTSRNERSEPFKLVFLLSVVLQHLENNLSLVGTRNGLFRLGDDRLT